VLIEEWERRGRANKLRVHKEQIARREFDGFINSEEMCLLEQELAESIVNEREAYLRYYRPIRKARALLGFKQTEALDKYNKTIEKIEIAATKPHKES